MTEGAVYRRLGSPSKSGTDNDRRRSNGCGVRAGRGADVPRRESVVLSRGAGLLR